MDIHAEILYLTVGGGIISALLVRILNFLVKSRCQEIRCCWGGVECTRQVVSESVIDRQIIGEGREIEIPSSMVNVRR
jgi:hypothetical protein